MDHRVEVGQHLIFMNSDFQYAPRYDVEQWLRDNVGKRGYFSSKWGWKGLWRCEDNLAATFWFRHARHALLFKLTWGGSTS